MHVHRQVLAAAERAADAGQRQPHLLGRHPQRQADLPLVDVQPLRRDVEVDAAVLGRYGQPGLRPEEGLVLHPDLEVEGDDDRRDRVGLAAAQPQVPDEVARPVHRRGVGVHRPAGVGDGGQHLVVDLDPLGRPAGGLRVVGGDERDRLALVADELRGQHRLVGVLQAEGVVPGDVVGGEHRPDARHGQRVGDVDAADAGVRVRAAQRDAPAHLVVPQVAGVGELAGDLERPVRPQRADSVADPPGAGDGRGDGRRRPAAHRGAEVATLAPHGRACRGGQADRVQDLLVARAAAEVAGQRLADLQVRRRSAPAPAGRARRRRARACRSRTAPRRTRRTPPAPGAAARRPRAPRRS